MPELYSIYLHIEEIRVLDWCSMPQKRNYIRVDKAFEGKLNTAEVRSEIKLPVPKKPPRSSLYTISYASLPHIATRPARTFLRARRIPGTFGSSVLFRYAATQIGSQFLLRPAMNLLKDEVIL